MHPSQLYGCFSFILDSGSKGICFDTCIWISKIFKEECHPDPERQKVGKIAQYILDNHPNKNDKEYLIILDTIHYEFRLVISQKSKEFGEIIRDYLTKAQHRIYNGENKNSVCSEFTKEIRNNGNINTLYEHYEAIGYGFYNLLDEQRRREFYEELFEAPLKFDHLLRIETKKCVNRYVKDRISIWFALDKENKKSIRNFVKSTPNVGEADRFHVLGSILVSLIENRNIRFYTYDLPLLRFKDKIEEFYTKKRKDLIRDATRILEVESSSS